jgi:hypothetical protein
MSTDHPEKPKNTNQAGRGSGNQLMIFQMDDEKMIRILVY